MRACPSEGGKMRSRRPRKDLRIAAFIASWSICGEK
jgi:hypothetical protein